jgi:hypothetical protein
MEKQKESSAKSIYLVFSNKTFIGKNQHKNKIKFFTNSF